MGTQWLIDEAELDDLTAADDDTWEPPGGWRTMHGDPMPNFVRIIREHRRSH